jgi:O-antigen/teichoic acid export membrane protein
MSLRAFDRYVLRIFASTAEVGVFGVANRITGPIALSNTALTYALERRAFVLAESPDAPVVVGLFFRRYVALAGAVAFAVSMVGPELVTKLLPSSYHGAIAALPILLFAVVAEGTLRLAGLGVDLAKRTRAWALAGVAHLVVSIGATVLLAHSLGVVGAAIGALGGALLAALVVGTVAERVFPLGLPLRRTLLFLAAAALVGVIAVGTWRTAPLPLAVRLVMAVACVAVALRWGKVELGMLARGAWR